MTFRAFCRKAFSKVILCWRRVEIAIQIRAKKTNFQPTRKHQSPSPGWQGKSRAMLFPKTRVFSTNYVNGLAVVFSPVTRRKSPPASMPHDISEEPIRLCTTRGSIILHNAANNDWLILPDLDWLFLSDSRVANFARP